MPRMKREFLIEYEDPTEEGVIKHTTQQFEDTETIDAELWADDYGYTIANKGWYQVTEIV